MQTVLNISICTLFILSFISCRQTTTPNQENQTIPQTKTDSCDDPDANINCCFVNMHLNPINIMVLADNNVEGERLIITGTIFKSDSQTVYSDVLLYAYQTDKNGIYSKSGNETGIQKWHGQLHGWCKTGTDGQYKIITIRPGAYPNNQFPAHIHAAVKTPNGKAFYITDFVFKGDSLVNEHYVSRLPKMQGGTGIIQLKKENNIWIGERNIVLSE